jgi:hypothetical protein
VPNKGEKAKGVPNTGKAAKGVARPASGGMTNMQDLLLAFQQEFGLALE